MTPQQLQLINDALSAYGAAINCEGYINRKGNQTSVKPVVQGKRLRFESPTGRLVASGPIHADWVETFVEEQWFWKKGE